MVISARSETTLVDITLQAIVKHYSITLDSPTQACLHPQRASSTESTAQESYHSKKLPLRRSSPPPRQPGPPQAEARSSLPCASSRSKQALQPSPSSQQDAPRRHQSRRFPPPTSPATSWPSSSKQEWQQPSAWRSRSWLASWGLRRRYWFAGLRRERRTWGGCVSLLISGLDGMCCGR